MRSITQVGREEPNIGTVSRLEILVTYRQYPFAGRWQTLRRTWLSESAVLVLAK